MTESNSTSIGQHCLIIGAGHAGTQFAFGLRREGWLGRITLLSEEPCLPYHRPPLSKDYLKGATSAESLLLKSPESYQQADILFLKDSKVVRIDPSKKEIRLADDSLSYDHLVIATGGRNRPLPVKGAELEGIHDLRFLSDADQIQSTYQNSRKAVIIGGGYVGLEIAASLSMSGIDVSLIERETRVMARVASQELSTFFFELHTDHDVQILTGTEVTEILGDTHVKGVRVDQGQVIDCDMVVYGIGAEPCIELALDANIKCDNGIIVDENLQTNISGIHAIGDCTAFVDNRQVTRLRLESVQNANDQARHLAKAMCGKASPYAAVPWFWSDQYNVKLQIAGLTGTSESTVRRTGETDQSFSIWHFRGDEFIAVEAINDPKSYMIGLKLLEIRKSPSPDEIADPSFDLRALIRRP